MVGKSGGSTQRKQFTGKQESTEIDTSIEGENEQVQGNGGRQMGELKEQIAEEMWRDYNLYLERQTR